MRFMRLFSAAHAHGVITNVDVSDARESEGVAAVITADDLIAAGISMDLEGTARKPRWHGWGKNHRVLCWPLIVCATGEPVAMIIADTMQQARDAAELIEFDYDELPVHLALAPGDTDIHAEAPGNLAFDWEMGTPKKPKRNLIRPRMVKLEVGDNRVIVNSIEPRGVYAEFDGERLHVAMNAQGVWAHWNRLSQMLNMPKITSASPTLTGGGFATSLAVSRACWHTLCGHWAVLCAGCQIVQKQC